MIRIRLTGLAAIALVALLVLNQHQPSRAQPGPINVVATFSIVGDFAQQVGGGNIALRTLVGAEGDAHTYEPTPADSVALAEATLILENGLGFEPWLDRLYLSSRSRATRVITTEGIDPLHLESDEEHAMGEHEEATDPHVWHDVTRTMTMVLTIRDALVEADPANAPTYQANAARYLGELQALDAWTFEQVGRVPEDRRKLVTTHDTFQYFARRYGFEVIGTALPVTTEAADPSAGEIAALVQRIQAEQVPAIFAENVSNPRLMQQIASAAGVRLAPTLYTDALGGPGTPGATYQDMIRHNVSTIVTALSQ